MKGLMMKYFVLKPGGNDDYAEASRLALLAYAKRIRLKNPELADDLDMWARVEQREASKQGE